MDRVDAEVRLPVLENTGRGQSVFLRSTEARNCIKFHSNAALRNADKSKWPSQAVNREKLLAQANLLLFLPPVLHAEITASHEGACESQILFAHTSSIWHNHINLTQNTIIWQIQTQQGWQKLAIWIKFLIRQANKPTLQAQLN